MGKTKNDINEENRKNVLELASAIIKLPTDDRKKALGYGRYSNKPKPETKQPSKRLQQIVTKIGSTFMTLEDSINEALELGRKEGFTDMEIGDMIRAEFKRLNRPRMTLSRYLPVTAKHIEKARPKSDFGNNLLPNKPAVVSNENKTLPTPINAIIATQLNQKQQGRLGILNEEPEELKEKETEPESIAAAPTVTTAKEQNQDDLGLSERQRDKEKMDKISLDDLRSFNVKEYSNEFCRYALMKIIHPYFDYKSEAKRYKEYYLEAFNQKNALLRHFKLCQNCFHGDWYARGKRSKSKIVKGVHDRGQGVDQAGNHYDNGWVCTKHRANDERLTKQLGPMVTRLFGRVLELSQDENQDKSK